MKTIIAATLIAFASTGALASSNDYERSIGDTDLFPELQSGGGVAHHNVQASSVFAYEEALGTSNLFVELGALNPELQVQHNEVASDTPVWRDVVSAEADLHG